MVAFIETAIKRLSEKYPGVNLLSIAQDGFRLLVALRELDDFTSKFWEIAEKDSRFKPLSGRWICFCGSGHAFDAHALPSILMSEVLSGKPIDETIIRITEFGKSVSTESDYYVALTGVVVPESCEVSEGIEILPWNLVPNCQQKSIFQNNIEYRSNYNGLRPHATCALKFKLGAQKVLHANAMSVDNMTDTNSRISNFVELSRDIHRVITVLSRKPVAILGGWPFAQNETARLFIGSGYSRLPSENEIVLFGASHTPITVNIPKLSRTFKNIEVFEKRILEILRVAIDRLSNSIVSLNPVNKAIDLGIALEALLIQEGDGKSELSYRASIRGAQLVGGTSAKRMENYKLIKRAYELRSKAVHTGRLDNKEKDIEVIQKSTELCADIAERVISSGCFPRWEEDLILRP